MATYKFGRLAPHPVEGHPRLRLAPHLAPVPPPPVSVDWYSNVKSFPMYGNGADPENEAAGFPPNGAGDCTEASNGHMIQVASTYGNVKTVVVPARAILEAYMRVSGYDPETGENDNGAVVQDVLADWRKNGIDGHRCDAFGQLDHTDVTEVKKSIWLFGNANLGIVVYESLEDDFNAGQPWARAEGAQLGGHCVPAVGYDTRNIYVVTWGKVQPMTWTCYAKVVEEAWGIVMPEWFNTSTNYSPTGLDKQGLGEDFQSLTGEASPFHDRQLD